MRHRFGVVEAEGVDLHDGGGGGAVQEGAHHLAAQVFLRLAEGFGVELRAVQRVAVRVQLGGVADGQDGLEGLADVADVGRHFPFDAQEFVEVGFQFAVLQVHLVHAVFAEFIPAPAVVLGEGDAAAVHGGGPAFAGFAGGENAPGGDAVQSGDAAGVLQQDHALAQGFELPRFQVQALGVFLQELGLYLVRGDVALGLGGAAVGEVGCEQGVQERGAVGGQDGRPGFRFGGGGKEFGLHFGGQVAYLFQSKIWRGRGCRGSRGGRGWGRVSRDPREEVFPRRPGPPGFAQGGGQGGGQVGFHTGEDATYI